MKRRIMRSALGVAGAYAAVSFAWIAFSDRVAIALADDYARLAGFQTAKGFFFVIATTLLLYAFSKRQFERIVLAHAEKERLATDALREKVALLREINHRVKNNLQILAGLVYLYGGDDERFSSLGQKVRSMSLAHELLTASPDMSSVRAGDFAARLAEALGSGIDRSGATIRGSGDDASLAADAAVAAGIFIAEASSNAARHARRADGIPVAIDIAITGTPEGILVTVRDDGPGFDPAAVDADRAGTERLGMTMMDAIAVQVGGSVSIRNDAGAVVELRIPRRDA